MSVTDTYQPGQDGLKRLKQLGRAKHIKHIKAMPSGLRALGGPIKFEAKLPDALLGALDGVVHLDDPDVQEVLSRLDTRTQEDDAMVRRIVKLKRTQFHGSPYTELMVYDWFTRNAVQFDYQVPLNGGRQTKQGQVLDFLVYTGGSAIAIPVQGNYWHSRPDVAASDELDKLTAMGQVINGHSIDKYVEVWERMLYHDRKTVLSYALANMPLGE